MKKHIISAIAVLAGVFPIVAQESQAWECDGYSLEIIPDESNNVEIKGYTGTDTELRVPATFRKNGVSYNVTSIARQAFYYNRHITEIHIPDGVKYIDEMAFTGCRNLRVLELPESLTNVGRFAFTEAGTETMVIPDSVNILNFGTFMKNNRLKTLVLGRGVKTVGEVALAELSGLKELYLLSSEMPRIDEGSTPFFDGLCSGATVYVPEELLANYPKRPENRRHITKSMSHDFEGGWDYFHDYRPIPDLFTVLYKDAYTVECGESLPILYETINYKGVTVYGMEWICDDESVAMVFDGCVSGVKSGTAKGRLKVRTNQGDFMSKDFTITVTGTNINDAHSKARTNDDYSEISLTRVKDSLVEIYNLDGTYLGSDTKRLTPGIYIKKSNGISRKITVK